MDCNIEDLLKLIKSEIKYSEEGWRKRIAENCPNCESLMRNPANWPKIENVVATSDDTSLSSAIVNIVGVELVNRWFISEKKDLRYGAMKWLMDFTRNPSFKLWEKLQDDPKRYVIIFTFYKYPGEPYETFERIIHSIEDFTFGCSGKFRELVEAISELTSGTADDLPSFISKLKTSLTPPVKEYVPSPEILNLRAIVKKAGDKELLELIDTMIEERKNSISGAPAVSMLPIYRKTYHPSRVERELIALVLDRFRENRYTMSPLPPIYLSSETPPIFIAFPELEDEYENREPFDLREIIDKEWGEAEESDRKREEVSREKRRLPYSNNQGEIVTIEEALGLYIPTAPQIILYQRGIDWFSKRYRLDEKILRAVVLVHEIGHWITHLLPKPEVPAWPTDLFTLTSMDVTEGWAQLITQWVADEIGGEFARTFEELNRHQTPPYHTYKEFTKVPLKLIISSLELLRQLRWPARLSDWKNFVMS